MGKTELICPNSPLEEEEEEYETTKNYADTNSIVNGVKRNKKHASLHLAIFTYYQYLLNYSSNVQHYCTIMTQYTIQDHTTLDSRAKMSATILV